MADAHARDRDSSRRVTNPLDTATQQIMHVFSLATPMLSCRAPSPKPAHQTAAVRRAKHQPLGIAASLVDRRCLETKHSLKIPLLWSYGAPPRMNRSPV